jgi:hypothetical protein
MDTTAPNAKVPLKMAAKQKSCNGFVGSNGKLAKLGGFQGGL